MVVLLAEVVGATLRVDNAVLAVVLVAVLRAVVVGLTTSLVVDLVRVVEIVIDFLDATVVRVLVSS